MIDRGKFIVIEGADGVGSTTAAKLLAEKLISQGTPAIYTAEPSSGEIGALARRLLKFGTKSEPGALALLFAADRLQHYHAEILPALNKGISVVSDRYVLSSLVYQSLDVSLDWIKHINAMAPPADITFLVTVPFDIAWGRISSRINAGGTKEIFDRRDLQERIHILYEQLLTEVGGQIIDGRGSPDDVLHRITVALKNNGAS